MSKPNPALKAAQAIIKQLETAIAERHSAATIRYEENTKLAVFARANNIDHTAFANRAEQAQETQIFCADLLNIIHIPESVKPAEPTDIPVSQLFENPKSEGKADE